MISFGPPMNQHLRLGKVEVLSGVPDFHKNLHNCTARLKAYLSLVCGGGGTMQSPKFGLIMYTYHF